MPSKTKKTKPGTNQPAWAAAEEAAPFGDFVRDQKVFEELDISPMTAWRWDRDETMIAAGWPPAVRFGSAGRKHRSRNLLEIFKKNLMLRAIAERGGKLRALDDEDLE